MFYKDLKEFKAIIDGKIDAATKDLDALRGSLSHADDNGTDIQTFLRTIDDSTSTIKGHFRVSNKLNADDFALFTITGSITEASGYFKVPCSKISGSASSFSNDEDLPVWLSKQHTLF